MSAQKRPFDLHTALRFGQYSPLTVTEVYRGTGDLPAAYCKKKLLEALELFKPLGYNCEKFFKVSITDKTLNVEVQQGAYYYKGVHLKQLDFSREVNNILHEMNTGVPFDLYDEHKIMDDVSLTWSEDDERRTEKEKMIVFNVPDEEQTHYILRNGKPNYVSWLIENVEFFSLPPDNLQALEKLEVLTFNWIYLKKLNEGNYSINASYLKSKSEFSNKIKVLNESKWNAFMESQGQTQKANYFMSWEDSWGGRGSRDFYSDNDEDQVMRGLMSGDGDLRGF